MDSSLYPQIIALIEAYERGLVESIRDTPTDTNAHILYMSPLRNMETTLEVSEAGLESSVIEMTREETTPWGRRSNETEKAEGNEEPKEDVFYQECNTGVMHGEGGSPYRTINKDVDVFRSSSNPRLALKVGQKEGFRYRAGVYKNKRITQAFDHWLAGDDGKITIGSGDNAWKTNFTIEECLDCLIDIELDLLIPPIEWIFSLTKLLQQIRDLISQIRGAMDPTNIFNPFCQFLAAIKENGLCPKNLPALQLILPSLFGKYSFDLLKIRLSWTGLFGPLIRGIVGSIVSALENVPRLANPFLDCIINSLTNFNKWVKTYLMSIDKIASEIGKGFTTIDKVITRIGEYYDMATTSSEEHKEMLRDLSRRVEYLRDTSLNAEDGANLSYQNYNYSNLASSYERFLDEFINSSYFETAREETVNNPKNLLKAFIGYCIIEEVLIVEDRGRLYALKLREFLFANEDRARTSTLNGDPARIQNAEYEDYQKLAAYIYDMEFGRSDSGYTFAKSRITRDEKETEKYLNSEANRLQREYISQRRQFEARNNLFAGSEAGTVKDPFKWLYDPEQTEGVVPGSRQNVDTKLFGSQFATAQYDFPAMRKYQLQGKLNYLPVEPSWFKEDWFDLGLYKSYQGSAMNQFIEKVLIAKVKECKQYISNVTQKVIATFKSLERFMDEYVMTDLKLAGQILELLHVIRFIKTIYAFVKNDWSCEDAQRNPEQVNMLMGNKEITFRAEIPSVREGVNISSDQKQLVVGSTNNKYSTFVDMTDCKNMFSKLNLNDFNLDAIYESMINVQ